VDERLARSGNRLWQRGSWLVPTRNFGTRKQSPPSLSVKAERRQSTFVGFQQLRKYDWHSARRCAPDQAFEQPRIDGADFHWGNLHPRPDVANPAD
jgi:hypothetical protein